MGILVKDKMELIDAIIADAKFRILKDVICDEEFLDEYILAEVAEQQLDRMKKRIMKILSH